MCIRFALWCQSFQHIALHSWWREVYWLTLGNVNTNHTKFWDLMGQFQNAIWTVKALKWASKVIYDEIYIIFKMAMLLLFLKIESSASYFLCIYKWFMKKKSDSLWMYLFYRQSYDLLTFIIISEIKREWIRCNSSNLYNGIHFLISTFPYLNKILENKLQFMVTTM